MSEDPKPFSPRADPKPSARPGGQEWFAGPISVLLVDDNEQNVELLQAYLEDLGGEIRIAQDGLDAIAQVARQRPDIILLDVMMPKMSGFQVCQKLKSDPATKDIPIIIVTALNETADIERAVELGADDFLTKPVNRLELVTRVRLLARGSELQRQVNTTLSELKRLSGG